MDDEEYLQPDWDPRSAKVAQLRGILLKHDVCLLIDSIDHCERPVR